MPEANSKQFPSNKFCRYPGEAPAATAKPNLLDRLREPLRSRRYSRRTEQSYCNQFNQLVSLHNIRPRFDIRSQPFWGRLERHSHIPGTFGHRAVKTTTVKEQSSWEDGHSWALRRFSQECLDFGSAQVPAPAARMLGEEPTHPRHCGWGFSGATPRRVV